MRTNVAMTVHENGHQRGRGFTLVELMAVVVVIGMLAALMAPALARQGDNGARLVCINNLRQMGVVVNMYAGDNGSYLAPCNWGIGGGKGWLYTGTSIPDPTVAPYVNNPITAWQPGLWFNYLQNQKYYLCPVDIENPSYAQRPNKLSSYVMSGAPAGFPGGASSGTSKVTDAWSPQCWLLWEPTLAEGAFEFYDGANNPNTSEGPGQIHTLNGSEILSVSGSVTFTTTQNISTNENAAGSGPGGKNLAWWSPYSSNGH